LHGEIKVWNVEEQACIHTFHPGGGSIRSLFFAGGADIACLAVTRSGSIIRLWRAKSTSDFSSETIGQAILGGLQEYSFCAVFSPSGSFLATSFSSWTGNGNESTLALYEIETMNKTQSVVMPRFNATCVAVSPDSKQLVCVGHKRRILLLQTDDFSNQRDLDTTAEAKAVCSIAFDPSCRVLAIGCDDGTLELQSL
jgi:WD40 repeat protein